MLKPTRWLQDNTWNCIDSIFNELFIGVSSKNLKSIHDNNNTNQQAYFIPRHYNNIQEVEIYCHTQKK